MAAGPLHATLVASTVTTLTLDLPNPVGDVRSFAEVPAMVNVLNVDGAAEVYFTVDGSTPTVGGSACEVLPATISALEVKDKTPGPTSVVKLISAGTPKISVRAAS